MRTRHSIHLVQIASVVSLLYMLTLSALSTTMPLNGRNPAQISDHYPNLFLPEGMSFMIWALIDLLLIFYAIRIQMRLHRLPAGEQPRLMRQGWLFSISNVLNGSWIFAWHFEFIRLSMGIMLMLLIILIMLYIDIPLDLSFGQRFLRRLPFSIYLGWICVATFSNVAVLLVSVSWQGGSGGPVFWALLLLGGAALLGWIFLWRYRDYGFALALAWAVSGILIRHYTTLQKAYPLVIGGAIGVLGLLAAGILIAIVRGIRVHFRKPI